MAISSTDHFPLAKGECDVHKIVRVGCFFCDGPHKSGDCLHRAEYFSSSAPNATENIVSSVLQVLKIPFTGQPEKKGPRNY